MTIRIFEAGKIFLAALAVVVISAQLSLAQTPAHVAASSQLAILKGDFPKWWTPELPVDVQSDVTSKGKRLAAQLQLADQAKEREVALRITEHFGRVWAWHHAVDGKLNEGWAAWDAARDNTNGKQKDELKALLVWTEQLAPIYAEFRPQIDTLLSSLRLEVGDEKATQLLDIITRSPGAKRTFDAYVAMIPEMTEDQKSVLWNRMVQAREDSLAAWSDKQIVKIFKMYKVRNELSIDYFGYNYQQRYQEWAKNSSK